MKKEEQQYRVSDFENAIRKSDLNIQISIVNYLPHSLYVKEITGFVEQNNRSHVEVKVAEPNEFRLRYRIIWE